MLLILLLSGLAYPIASYSTYLKEVYMSMSHCNITQHWTNLPQCEYIQLAMIENRGLRYRQDRDTAIVRLAQQGEVNTILNEKQPISLGELLYPPLVELPPPVNRVVLFEGAPGGGKTTLALYICHQWAQDTYWLSRYELVVLVYLRDPSVHSATTLADILPASNSDMSQRMASQIQVANGQGVLFIFDGWDEFPQHLMINSVVSTIIRQPSKYSLHKSAVVITSRPESTVNLLQSAHQRVEILGFTQQQIREYVKKALTDETQNQKFVQYLDEHPTIKGFCYVPLHAAILVHVFLAMNKVLPTARHELFCALAICCIVREVETHEPGKIQVDIRSLDDLPDDLNRKFHNHCTLAYEGLMQSKVVFYQEDLRNANLPAKLPSLGLLQAVEGLTLTSKTLSYNFLHLSIQELLAAYYISKRDSLQQVKILKRLFIESPRYRPVLEFYSGITKLSNQKIQDFLYAYQNEQTCFENILPLLHCLFEAQRPSSCWLISPKFRNLKLVDTRLSSKDFSAIGYFISSLLSTVTSSTNNICVHLYFKRSSDMHLLLRELAKCTVKASPMSPSLEIALNSLYYSSLEGIRLMASYLKESPPLSKLWLYDTDKGIQTKTPNRINPDNFFNQQLNPELPQVYLHLHTEQQRLYDEQQRLYDEQQRLYDEKQQLYDKQQQQLYDEKQQLYDEKQRLYDKKQQIYDKQRQLYDKQQELYHKRQRYLLLNLFDHIQQQLYTCNRQQQLYDEKQQLYDKQQRQLYDEKQQLYDKQRQLYDKQRQLYDKQRQLSLEQQPYHELKQLDKQQQLYNKQQQLYEELYDKERQLHSDDKQQGQLYDKQQRQLYDKQQRQLYDKQQQLYHEQQQLYHEQQLPERERLQLYHDDVQQNLFFTQQFFMYDGQPFYTNDEQHFFSIINFQLGDNNKATFYNAFCKQPRHVIERAHHFFLLLKYSVLEDDNDGLLHIARALQSNTSLTLLRLMNLKLKYTEHNGLALTEMLHMNQSLRQLDLSGNPRLSNSTARCIFLGLQGNTTLVELQLNDTGITDEGAEHIAQALQINRSLLILGISKNSIGDDGFARIAASLRINTTLTSLGISDNRITDIKLKAQEINTRRQQLGQPTVEIF